MKNGQFSSPIKKSKRKLKSWKYEPFDILCIFTMDYEYPPGILNDATQITEVDGRLDYFSSLDSILDQKFSPDSCSLAKKSPSTAVKCNTRFTKQQIEVLKREFSKNDSLESKVHAEEIAQLCQLQNKQVYKWFMNRRFRYKNW